MNIKAKIIRLFMLCIAGGGTTYEDGSTREDLLNQILITNPKDTPFTSNLKVTKCSAVNHQWLEDYNLEATDNATIEGAALAYSGIVNPERVSNYTQIFKRDGQVSSTQQWVNKAGITNMVAYQETKAITSLSEDIELAALTGSLNAGATDTARRMAGALNFVTTNATAVASGTTLTESFYNNLNELVWNQRGRVDEVYCGMRLKRIISGYTAGAQKQVMLDDIRLVNRVDVYESDMGIQKIFATRALPYTDNSAAILGIDSTKWALAIGEAPKKLAKDNVAQTIHGTNFVIRGELTLEARGQKHCFKATGLSTAYPS